MSLFQGVLGAQIELSRIVRPRDKLLRLAGISRLFLEEIVGTVRLAPYAARALRLHRSLPAWDPAAGGASAAGAAAQPSIHRAVRYCREGPGDASPRCTVDVYVPPGTRPGEGTPAPVVLFCHGGVWAAGESWHYSPMGSTLARLGVLAVVMQYSLYPDALVPAMVDEVSAALTWTLDNAEAYGGDPERVSLLGHSAGAQLCMMALLHRAARAHAAGRHAAHPAAAAEAPDVRMPQRLVGMAGVYDISKHYEYERDRGVHELSTMKRAIGGLGMAAAVSPSVVLGTALQRARRGGGGGEGPGRQPWRAGALRSQRVEDAAPGGGGREEREAAEQEEVLSRFYEEFTLSGEAIAHRIGFDRGSDHYSLREELLAKLSLRGADCVPSFPLEAARYLPPTILMSSCTDLTVPWFESAEMFHRMVDAGVPCKHLVYNKVGHGDFVVNWPSKASSAAAAAAAAKGAATNSHQPEGAGTDQDDGYDSDDTDHTSARKIDHRIGTTLCASTQSDTAASRDQGASSGAGGSSVGSSGQKLCRATGSGADRAGWEHEQLMGQLPPYGCDLCMIVSGSVDVDYVMAPGQQAAERGGANGSSGSLNALAGVGKVGTYDSAEGATARL